MTPSRARGRPDSPVTRGRPGSGCLPASGSSFRLPCVLSADGPPGECREAGVDKGFPGAEAAVGTRAAVSADSAGGTTTCGASGQEAVPRVTRVTVPMPGSRKATSAGSPGSSASQCGHHAPSSGPWLVSGVRRSRGKGIREECPSSGAVPSAGFAMAFIVLSRSGRFPAARVCHSPGTAPPWSCALKFSVPVRLLPTVAGGVAHAHHGEGQTAIGARPCGRRVV